MRDFTNDAFSTKTKMFKNCKTNNLCFIQYVSGCSIVTNRSQENKTLQENLENLDKPLYLISFSSPLPIRGTASEVVGMISDTRFMKTVRDSRTVTSAKHQ